MLPLAVRRLDSVESIFAESTAEVALRSDVMVAVDSAKIDSTLSNLRTASGNMNSLTLSLDSTGRALNRIVAKVDSGNGSAAKLVNDPALYNDVHSLLGRMDSLV